MIQILFVVALSACTTTVYVNVETDAAPPADAAPIEAWALPASVRAAAEDPSQLALWSRQARDTVESLNFSVRAVSSCGDLFVFMDPEGAADHVIELVTDCGNALEPQMLGGESAVAITIWGVASDNWQSSPLRGTIVHELGHAAGLGHASVIYGDSAMTMPPGGQLQARDASALACRAGCGPCDLDADPYSR